MNKFKKIPIGATFLSFLLVVNVVLVIWNMYQHARFRVETKKYKLEILHTNDFTGIGLFEAKPNNPIWTQFSQNGYPVIENHFFRGENVFDITIKSNCPPVFNVYFHGPGKSLTWWLNAGGGQGFTQRIFYNTNGEFSRNEVWLNQDWCVVVRRNEKNGVIINGEWHQLAFNTNGMWIANPTPTNEN